MHFQYVFNEGLINILIIILQKDLTPSPSSLMLNSKENVISPILIIIVVILQIKECGL